MTSYQSCKDPDLELLKPSMAHQLLKSDTRSFSFGISLLCDVNIRFEDSIHLWLLEVRVVIDLLAVDVVVNGLVSVVRECFIDDPVGRILMARRDLCGLGNRVYGFRVHFRSIFLQMVPVVGCLTSTLSFSVWKCNNVCYDNQVKS